jgi:hypothetical protein
MTKIVSQDRDKIVEYNTGDLLVSATVVRDGIEYGHNVIVNTVAVGTFDSLEEARREITAIATCKYPIYVVNGFEEYEAEEK